MVRVSPRILERRIKAAKSGVTILQVAQDLTELTKRGERWRGKCPICENGERSEAFSLTEDLGLFHCFSCGSGGDVVRLAQCTGPFPSAAEAAAWLGHTYNLDLPERPDSWFRKQDRQARLRERVALERLEVKRRRIFKYLILPCLEDVAEVDRQRETDLAWERFKKIPAGLLGGNG